MHLHILGICGTLMGSIAILARQLGHQVSGSDQNVYPPMSDQLMSAGIELRQGYTAANIPRDADLVIIGNAGLPRGNEAVEQVLNNNMAYTSGAEWLGRYLLHDRWVLAVAGTHGKTTTASMLTWILECAGLNPGFLIGGVPLNFTESARLGDAPFFVIEADEYDTSYFDRRSKFLHYHPQTLIINNLEFDHADIFDNLGAIQNQFHLLLRTIPGNGLIIHPRDDANLDAVFNMGCWTDRLSFSNRDSKGDVHTETIADDFHEFRVAIKNKVIGSVNWTLTGRHNVENALAAIAAARHAGVPAELACEALSTFKSVKRRMEVIHEDATVRVYDDFAHHPTAIATTLEGLRRQSGEAFIAAVIEPASHTMKKGTHAGVLADATRQADQVIWFQPEAVQWSMQQQLSGANSIVCTDIDEILNQVEAAMDAHTFSHVVIMSNGAFSGLRERLVARLVERTGAGDELDHGPELV